MLNNILSKKIEGIGLGFFRFLFFLALFFEVKQLYFFKELLYGPFGELVPSNINLGIILWYWMPVCIMLSVGIFTRINTILNYVFCLVFIATMKVSAYEYHMFYIYMGVSFLVMFMPISKCLSLDRLWQKLKYSSSSYHYIPDTKVNVWNYWMLLLTGVGFMYFGSVFFKLSSELWLSGLGMWLPSSMPMATYSNLDFILDIKFFSIALGYVSFIFEALFIFLFWFKPFRIPLFVLGIGLHLGIAIVFPIPWFGLGMVALVFLLFPLGLLKRLLKKLESSKPALIVYYDLECPLCTRTKIIIEHFDVFKRINFKSVQLHSSKQEVLKGLEASELYTNIYSVDKKKKLFKGLDTYIAILKNTLYFYPVGIILEIPGFYHVGSFVYDFVAKNRNTERCTDDSCGYTPPFVPSKEEDIKILQNITLSQLKRPFYVFGFIIMFILQVGVIYNGTPFSKDIRVFTGLYDTKFDKYMVSNFKNLTKFTRAKTYFGITKHGLFVDSHFRGYNHIIAVTYIDKKGNEVFLPFIDEDGNPGNYLLGPTWAKWTFRLNNPRINMGKMVNGLEQFIAFWAKKNHINLKRGKSRKFNIRVKKIEIVNQWEKGFKKRMENRPWLDGGYVTWDKGVFKSFIRDIEKI
jgi:predicted DCC family thiol-disulfide oxidoreductase YuxK